MGSNVLLCRPLRDSIRSLWITRHFRAGLWIVPSLRDCSRWFDKPVWSWAALRRFNLNIQIAQPKN